MADLAGWGRPLVYEACDSPGRIFFFLAGGVKELQAQARGVAGRNVDERRLEISVVRRRAGTGARPYEVFDF